MISRHNLIRRLKGIRRDVYGMRRFIPWLKEIHRLESMVGPLGYWKELQSYQLNTLVKNGMKSEDNLLDLGCGPLQGGIAFINYLDKNNYYGIDIDQTRIEAAAKQIKKNNLESKNPFISVTNDFGRKIFPVKKFNYMWASQLLYYFDDIKINNLMDWISIALKKDGKFLGDIIGPKHYEFKQKEHNWYLHTLNSLSNSAKSFNLTVQDLGEIANFGYPQRLSLKTNHLIQITKIN
jgi:predicted TPR repeat methyltransferase